MRPRKYGQELYGRAKSLIPGGTQLLSKRPELFLPNQWPSYYSRASGVEVWDLDSNRYIDMSTSGIGSCTLGFADPDVNAAVLAAIEAGSMATLNCPEEIELAELLLELHPWASMVRYARGGGEAMAVAVRIARAYTRRERIAFCGYHGWHDWYLAANLAEDDVLDGHLLPGLDPAGVPRSLLGTALPFAYNDPAALESLVARHRHELAAIIMEPVRNHLPEPGFLERVREVATSVGAVLIFDEVTSAFRMNTGGIHLLFGVEPDLAVFAKGISNGYPMAAVIGRGEVMQAAQTTFISSTYWTERIGPVAALATIRKHRRHNVGRHLVHIGERVQEGWRSAATRAGLTIEVSGIPPLAHLFFKGPEAQAAHTLFTQLMLEEDFLAAKAFYATFAHRDEHVDAYLRAVDRVFSDISEGLRNKKLQNMLKGPVAHLGFQRLT